MDKDKYLTVGEAAKELGINKNTLLYYDREGVIISLRDENNYRYYHINQIKNEEQAVLYTTREIDDLNAVQMLFQKIEERGYITDGDMSVEVVTPFGENPKNKNRIKIYKIHVKSLTSEQLTGLE